MLWSLAALGAAAAAIIAVEAWLTEKIGAAGPFSRHLAHQAHGLLMLSLAVLMWRSGTVAIWVLAAGIVHYVALAVSLATLPRRTAVPPGWQHIARPLGAIALAAALAPAVPVTVAIAAAAGAVVVSVVDAYAALSINRRDFS